MKMKDVFDNNFKILDAVYSDDDCDSAQTIDKQDRYIEHAVNNHDKLTEENARLREALTGCSNELEFYIKKENAMIRRANDGDDSYSINSHYLAQAKQLLKGDE